MDDKNLKKLTELLDNKTDIGHGLEHLFKSSDVDGTSENDIDLRTRLNPRSAKAHSVISFLQTIKVTELKHVSLADGLNVLSHSLKRHVVSLDGKSRSEIIEIFKAEAESKKTKADFNMFEPVK